MGLSQEPLSNMFCHSAAVPSKLHTPTELMQPVVRDLLNLLQEYSSTTFGYVSNSSPANVQAELATVGCRWH